MQCFLEPLEQHCTRFLPVQCCPKRIKASLNKIFSCALLSEEQHRIGYLIEFNIYLFSEIKLKFTKANYNYDLSVQICPKSILRKHWTELFPMRCCLECLGQLAWGFYLFNIGPYLTDNFHEENNLRNVVLTMLGQHCIRILPRRCCLNMSKTILH